MSIAEQEVKSLMESVASVKEDVRSVQHDVTTVKGEIKGLKSELSSVKQNLSTVKEDVDSISSDVDSIKGSMGTINSDLNSMKAKVSDLATSIEELADSVSYIRRSLFEESLERPSMVSIIKENSKDIDDLKRSRPQKQSNDSGDDIIKSSKRAFASTLVGLAAAALFGFVGRAVWDSIVNNIYEAGANRPVIRQQMNMPASKTLTPIKDTANN